jgi:hypothetical protein
MLAVKDAISAGKDKNGAAFELQAANDQLATLPVLAATAPSPETPTAASATSWVQDWTQIWTNAATTMLNASAASLEAIGTHATPTAPAQAPAASEISLWSQPARSTRPRSWYRPPTPNLLDPTVWGFPAPLSVYGVPVTPQMAMGFNPMNPLNPLNPMQSPLTALIQVMQPSSGFAFGMPFGQPSPYANPFVRPPENPMTAWMSVFAPQPANPWSSMTKALTGALTPTPYSSYRSDSGHAVAQIAKPEARASSAEEAMTAMWNLFAWPTPARAH